MTREKIRKKGESSRQKMIPFANFDAYATTSPMSMPTPTRPRLLRGCSRKEHREVSISLACYVNIIRLTMYTIVRENAE